MRPFHDSSIISVNVQHNRRVLFQVVTVGIVGGSDLSKIKEQLGDNGALSCCSPPGRTASLNHPVAFKQCLHVNLSICQGQTPHLYKQRLSIEVPDTFEGICVAVLELADFTFSENGLMAHKGQEQLAVQSIKKYMGEENIKKFINFVLKYIADLDIPVKRGTFIEFRNGMLNVSPIGRNCSQEERDAFEQFDHGAHVRCSYVESIAAQPGDVGETTD